MVSRQEDLMENV